MAWRCKKIKSYVQSRSEIKFKMLSLPVVLLVISWGVLGGTISAVAEKGVIESEKELTQLLTEECNKNIISALSFPDGFRSQTLFTVCDVAFAFSPHKNAKQLYSYQRATNEIGNSIPNSQILFSKNYFLVDQWVDQSDALDVLHYK